MLPSSAARVDRRRWLCVLLGSAVAHVAAAALVHPVIPQQRMAASVETRFVVAGSSRSGVTVAGRRQVATAGRGLVRVASRRPAAPWLVTRSVGAHATHLFACAGQAGRRVVASRGRREGSEGRVVLVRRAPNGGARVMQLARVAGGLGDRVPVRLASSDPPPFSSSQEGTLVVLRFLVTVSPDGKVKEVEQVLSSGVGVLDRWGYRQVRGWRFRPLHELPRREASARRPQSGEVELRLLGGVLDAGGQPDAVDAAQ